MSENAGGSELILRTGASPRGWHRLQLAAECLQKFAWAYRGDTGKVDLKSRPALARGSLLHLALAQHYSRMRCRQNGTPENEWCEPEEAVQLIARLEGIEAHVDIVLRTFRAYLDHYSNDEWKLQIVHVEELMSTTIGGKYLLTGRIDLGYSDLSGRIYICDHKTSGRVTAQHKSYYSVSGQLLGYSRMGREKYGDRYAGMVINLIQLVAKPGDTPKFERIELPRSPNLEARFDRTVADIEESIERMDVSGRAQDDWPKAMNEMSCYGRYGACEYIDQCRHGAGAKSAGNWTWDPGA
jgi:hypothetical protein